MSELKAYGFPVDHGDFTAIVEQFYRKSEADKVIAELKKKLDLYKRGWEEADKINAYLYAQLRHHKRKRCLAMAKWCHDKWIMSLGWDPADGYTADFFLHYKKWEKRWLELAEKFREAK